MNVLAVLLGNQDKHDMAKPIHCQMLALIEKVLGKEHPNKLASMNNLALLLRHQDKYNEAEPRHC